MAEVSPRALADIVIDNSDFANPVVLRSGPVGHVRRRNDMPYPTTSGQSHRTRLEPPSGCLPPK